LFLGALRYQLTQSPPDVGQLAFYNDKPEPVTITAVVNRPPIPHDSYVEYRLAAEALALPGEVPQPVRGGLLAQLPLGSDWSYGDRLRLLGELEMPADGEDFSYRRVLARWGIGSLISFPRVQQLDSSAGSPFLAALYGLRERSLETIHELYRDPEASLLAGILLGDESGLSEPLKDAFNATGARHIIAISGFNITIIAGFALGVFQRWLGPRRGAWMAAGVIGAYTLLVGADAAVVRAAVMGGLALLARQTGSRQVGLNTLAFTAAIMAAFNPLLVWDVGFQLSVAATLGLVLYAERLTAWAHRALAVRLSADWAQRLSRPVSEYLLLSLAAQATTLPLLLYHFQRLSLVSIPVNVLILPAQPALMMLGGLSVVTGPIFLPLGSLLAAAAWPFAAFSIRVVELAAALPGAALALAPLNFGWVLLYFLVLFAATHRKWLPWLSRLRPRPAFVFAAFSLVTLWLWSAAFARPDGLLSLRLLDTGGGEALLIRTPTGPKSWGAPCRLTGPNWIG
jgi:competence protein ComEC